MCESGRNARLLPPHKPKLLLVHRSTMLQDFDPKEHPRIARLLDDNDVSVARWRSSHERQIKSIDAVIKLFSKAQLDLRVIHRDHLSLDDTQDVDLLVVVGGDGTVLHASHFALDLPVLAFNADPLSSTGFLCSTRAEQAEHALKQYLNGQLSVRTLHRMRLSIDHKIVPVPVLNDVLYTHECPAATSKYVIETQEESEIQQSSGIWVCTAAGSTAAMRSAGGELMPLDDQRLQFRVREAAPKDGLQPRLQHGFVHYHEKLRLVSKMLKGKVYLDGPHLALPIEIGHRLDIDAHPHPLRQVLSPDASP
ncbi:MAG: NAD(+)/NADH kinase [Myxococcota bacterium]|nr:NAD(+)/NADH kinase [Myxococcota bacterium]